MQQQYSSARCVLRQPCVELSTNVKLGKGIMTFHEISRWFWMYWWSPLCSGAAVSVLHSQQQKCGDAAADEVPLFSVWTLGGKLSMRFPCAIVRGGSMNEAVGSWRRGFIASHGGMRGQGNDYLIFLLWPSLSGSHTNTHLHTMSPFSIFLAAIISPYGDLIVNFSLDS